MQLIGGIYNAVTSRLQSQEFASAAHSLGCTPVTPRRAPVRESGAIYGHERLLTHCIDGYSWLAKVGVEGSNPFARSKFSSKEKNGLGRL